VSDDLDFLPAAPNQRKPAEADAATKPKTEALALSSPKPSPTGSESTGSESTGSEPTGSEPTGSEPSGDSPPGARAELPTWNRSRRKRNANAKAEAQDDAFQRGVRQASRQVIDAPKLVIGAIVIVVAAVAGGVALHQRSIQGNAEAARTLQTATAAIVRGQVVPAEQQAEIGESIRFYRAPIYTTEEEREAAIGEALTAARGSGAEGVEQDATLVAAARAVRNGDFDGALGEYDAFLESADDDHPLRFLALEGKGHALEAKGEYEAALAVFASIAPHPIDFYRHMALYHQGRMLEALERNDEAMAIYEQYFEEFPPTREEMATPLVRKRVEKLDPDFAARLSAPPPSPIPTL
jgi:tetratricopeptide (TPR) repeat protein